MKGASTVLCVCRSGGPYNGHYVRRLRAGLRRHGGDFAFLCLSDRAPGDLGLAANEVVPLRHDWPGWWSKIELFRPDLPIPWDAPVVYLDLDTVIVGDVTPLLDYRGPWATGTGYRYGNAASGIMAWRHGEVGGTAYRRMVEVPRKLQREYDNARGPGNRHGDQGFILDCEGEPPRRVADFQPGICSYKHHCRGDDSVPSWAHIVQFHGKPRPHECREPWLDEHWREK